MSSKEWFDKDFYKVLGVSKDATADEIKKAYRKLARENHPDAHPGDDKAEQRFKDISEANSVLGDAKKRKAYDSQRSLFGGGGGGFRFPGGGGQGAPGQTPGGNINDLFRNASGSGIGDLFGNLFGQTTRTTTRAPRRGSDVETEAQISFIDAVEGVTVTMNMVSDAPCATCHGTGAKPGTMPTVCPKCQGSGMVASSGQGGMFGGAEPCDECHGRGMVVEDPCPTCHGSGRGQSTRTMQVRIPAGVTDGQQIRIKGKGGPGENGGPNGDLYVKVHVEPDKRFGRSGNNLTIDVPVLFTEAALGATIEVPTLQGPKVKLRLAAGTPNGRVLRVRGRGVARKDGTKGDLLVSVVVAVPEHLSPEATEALKAYAEIADQPDPRAGLFEQ